VFLFGFEQGSGSIAVRGGWNVEIGPLGDFQGRWEESENLVLVFLAFHGLSFPRPTSGPSTLTRSSLANSDRRFYPRQTAKNLFHFRSGLLGRLGHFFEALSRTLSPPPLAASAGSLAARLASSTASSVSRRVRMFSSSAHPAPKPPWER